MLKQAIHTFFSQTHFESVSRGLLKSIGGAAITHGFATDQTWSKVTGVVITGLGFLYSYINAQEAKKAAAVPPSAKAILPLGLLMLCMVGMGCNTTQQTVAYNTLYSTEQAVTASYSSYIALVIQGKVTTNNVPKVSQTFNQLQAAILLAKDAVQYNTNALAPTNITVEATDLITLITQIEGGK